MNASDKLLYIGIDVEEPKSGGDVCHKRNEEVLNKIFESNFYKYSLFYDKNILKHVILRLLLFYPGVSFSVFRKIKKEIEKLGPQFIFVSSSHYGNLVKYIKKHFSVTVITFFHNIEIQYAKSYFSLSNIKSWFFLIMTKKNESSAVRYSDKCIVINNRDADVINQNYKRQADYILPFSLKDTVSVDTIVAIKQENCLINKRECLFVGSNFYANREGLKWFIKNVLPYVNIHLHIIGTGMSKSFSNADKITVIDYVKDLSGYYIHTDFIISPIFSGSGMKTKTAEAMMWGKAIIGSDEAFCGYEIDNVYGLYRCNTAEEMIGRMQDIYNEDIFYFNQDIRELYLTKYSFTNTIELVNKFFDSFGHF
jgi:glycosyltransferase involved in cell wall biosynthesis